MTVDSSGPRSNGRLPAHAWLAAFGLAVATLVALLATIFQPGLTVDEPINGGHGRQLVHAFKRSLTWPFQAKPVFDQWKVGHEHPPLSRFLIGLSEEILSPTAPGDPPPSGKLGRPASAVALASIVFLATLAGWRIGGPVAGISSGVAIILAPRLFAHGRIASPEVVSAFFVLAALLAVGPMLDADDTRRQTFGWGRAGFAGVLLGLALLTKLSAILLPIAVALAVAFRRRGVGWYFLWLTVGLAAFVAGWPWLWPFDFPGYSPGWMGSMERLREFALTGVNRATVYVWYFSRQYPDGDIGVPWHYVWIYFATTVPLALQMTGLFTGVPAMIARAREDGRALLILTTLATTLALFTMPIGRYDGERLFLAAFPLWGIVIGVGAAKVAALAAPIVGRPIAWGSLVLLAIISGVDLIRFNPTQLSYYNTLVGGLTGADRLGLEATYWGDTLTDETLDSLAQIARPGDRAALFPTLYAGHAFHLATPATLEKKVTIVPGDLLEKDRCAWAILFNRAGYLHDPVPLAIQRDWLLEKEFSLDGVWLTRIYRRPVDEESRR